MVFEIKRYFKLASILSDLKFKSPAKTMNRVIKIILNNNERL